mgnify:CR=1 FL=1
MHADMPINRFKHALAAGRLQIGLWSNMLHPLGLEAMGGAGADWILLDCEHGPGDPNEVLVAACPITDIEHIVEAVLVDAQTADWLAIDTATPCLSMVRRTWSGASLSSGNPATRLSSGNR